MHFERDCISNDHLFLHGAVFFSLHRKSQHSYRLIRAVQVMAILLTCIKQAFHLGIPYRTSID